MWVRTNKFGLYMLCSSNIFSYPLANLFFYFCKKMLLLDISALALGDPSVTVQEVTPPTLAAGALFPTEVHMF